MYKMQYIYNDEREMGCQTRQSIDSAEEYRLTLYILLSRKGVHCTFVYHWEAEQVARYDFTKVARTEENLWHLDPRTTRLGFRFVFCKEPCKS